MLAVYLKEGAGKRCSERVWRKVPECDAQSVFGGECRNAMLRVCLEESAGMRCSVFGGRCRKAMLGLCLEEGAGKRCSDCVWRKVPESDARNVEDGAGKRC